MTVRDMETQSALRAYQAEMLTEIYSGGGGKFMQN